MWFNLNKRYQVFLSAYLANIDWWATIRIPTWRQLKFPIFKKGNKIIQTGKNQKQEGLDGNRSTGEEAKNAHKNTKNKGNGSSKSRNGWKNRNQVSKKRQVTEPVPQGAHLAHTAGPVWAGTEMLRPSLRSTLNVSSVSNTFNASGNLISTAKVFGPILHQLVVVFFS